MYQFRLDALRWC